jgi:hypothetical protein
MGSLRSTARWARQHAQEKTGAFGRGPLAEARVAAFQQRPGLLAERLRVRIFLLRLEGGAVLLIEEDYIARRFTAETRPSRPRSSSKDTC